MAGLTTGATAAAAGIDYSDNVQILERANGSLDINGDNGNNHVEVCPFQGGYEILVYSNEGVQSTTVESVTTDLRVNLKGGHDTFGLNRHECVDRLLGSDVVALDHYTVFPRDVRINLGSGDDDAYLFEVEVGDDLTVLAGSGADTAIVVDAEVADRFDVNMSSGDSFMVAAQVEAAKSSFRGGNNDDQFIFENSFLGKAPRILTLAGDDTVLGFGSGAEGRITTNTGNGDDVFGWAEDPGPCIDNPECCEEEECCGEEECCEGPECCVDEQCCVGPNCIEPLIEEGYYFNLILGGGDDEAHFAIELISEDRIQGGGGNGDFIGLESDGGARINGFEFFGEPDYELFD
ncbi:MAG: hypothetical protein ACRBK7_07360 [Acidimicrobiales bacterium]